MSLRKWVLCYGGGCLLVAGLTALIVVNVFAWLVAFISLTVVSFGIIGYLGVRDG